MWKQAIPGRERGEIMSTSDNSFFDDADLIFGYSRAEAISDGVLVNVTKTAKEAGIRYHTCVTSAVWERYIKPDRTPGQSIAGRLWDTLWMFTTEVMRKHGARSTPSDCVMFKVSYVIKGRNRLVELKALCGPGDQGEPVLTIMLPEED